MLISSNSDPFQITEHINTFIAQFIAAAGEDLTEEKFQILKKSLISKILEPFQSLKDYFDFICRQINRGTFVFDRKTNLNQLQGYLSQIKREDVVNMLKECLGYDLSVWVVAEPHKKVFEDRKIFGLDSKTIKKKSEYFRDLTVNK